MQQKNLWVTCGLVLPLLLAGCKEIETTTRIFADGSIERTIVLNREPANYAESHFTLPVDSTWSISTAPAGKEGKETTSTARKRFASIGDLQQLYARAGAQPWQVRIDVGVTKKFRWFYTYYDYRETYHAYNPFLLLPKMGYLEEKDLAAWIAAPDSDDTWDDRVESWLIAGVFEEFYQSLLTNAARLHDPILTPELIAAKKGALRTALVDSLKEDDLNNLTAACERVLGTSAVRMLKPALDSTYQVIEKKIEFDDDVRHARYRNRVVMPGRVWASNGLAIDSTQVEWPVSAKQFFFTDYTMWAQSRHANRGMVLLSAGIVVLALAGLLLPRLRRLG